MGRLFNAAVIAAGTLALLAGSVGTGAAKSRKKSPRVLVIHQRSFLDNGKYPPIGSMARYVTNDTRNNSLIIDNMRGRYGGETLPGRFGPYAPN